MGNIFSNNNRSSYNSGLVNGFNPGNNNNNLNHVNNQNNSNFISQQSDSLLIARYDSDFNNLGQFTNAQLLVEHQKTKNMKSYKNPIILLKSSLKLEKDSLCKNTYYVTFKYTALTNFNVTINFNAILKEDGIISNSKFPFIIIPNIQKSNESCFFEKMAFIDINKYLNTDKEYLISEKGYYDIIIELTALKENGDVECILANFCNLVVYKNESNNLSAKIKCQVQKLKVKDYWFEMHSIYGLDPSIDSSSNDCEACCTKKKNTIFLPCKHSYACSDCSIVVRLPHNQCPLCRQLVNDCLIIDENKN